VVLELALYAYLSGQALERRWGDVRAGFWMLVARLALLKRRPYGRDPRNWRPQILVFSGDPARRLALVRLASWFGQERGVVTACNLLLKDLTVEGVDVEETRLRMRQTLKAEGLTVFSEVAAVRDFESGAIDVAQASGIVGIKPNTVMFGWSGKQERLESYIRIMRALSRAGRCTVLARIRWRGAPGQKKQIDIWWGGLERNGDLMLLLAHLLQLEPVWEDARIFVRSIVADQEEKARMEARLAFLIPESRIHANIAVVVRPPGQSIGQIMRTHSRNATLVLVGLMDPGPGREPEYVRRLAELTDDLPTTIFVRNTELSSVPVLLTPSPDQVTD